MSEKSKIADELIRAYWGEMETVMNYVAHSVNLDGVRAEEIKKILIAEVTSEMTHAQTLAKRVKELGSQTPGSEAFRSVQKTLQPSSDTTDVVHTIKGVIKAEKEAVELYRSIIKLCEGKDYVTQDLCIRLLADEEAHLSTFEGFLKEYTP
ncbi:MAG: ferritin-like domain-containing protein [candidate division Zixibacteria bacterium]|nr:ferritin-like domain-containing protein [candidate division Zixibacteria bacterium]